MSAKSAEEICSFFRQYMAEGDVEALLGLYDPEAVFLDQSGEVKKGHHGFRESLTPMALARRSLTSGSSR